MIATLSGARVVTPGGVRDGSWVVVDGDSIAEIGTGLPPHGIDVVDLDGRWVLPGFVDIHVHGGGGHSMVHGLATAVEGTAEFHRAHGTTALLASLVTAPGDELVAATGRIATQLASVVPPAPTVSGIHLEGPFLSAARCGAQNPDDMIDPDPDLVVELLDAADGRLRMVTIAPERPGALEVIRMLVDAGVVVAVGHTDASYDETRAAVDAGARVATHLGNAMRPLHHRRPGPIAACLESADVACELIADGHHLDPGFVRFVAATKGAAATVLITDAMAAAGQPDGRYALGSLDVDVIDGVATLVDGDALAGSTLTMDAAVRNAVSWGIPIETASAAASGTPARLLGLDDRTGAIEAGKRADLVVLDDSLHVDAVIVAGDVVHGALMNWRT